MGQSNGSQNVNETGNKNYSNNEIEGTPFRQISEMNENTGEWNHYLVLGDYRVTKEMESSNLVEKLKVKNIDWELLTTVIAVIVEQTIKLKGEDKNNG